MLPFTLQQLRILKAVATERNFSKAAAILYVSQPSLSKQIKILEKNLDTLLINRERNKISLTENGKLLLQYSERILALCEESCRALIDLKNGDRGNLTVGASQTIGTYLMPRILALFAQTYPQINLRVQVNSTRIIAKTVINREIDIAVVGPIHRITCSSNEWTIRCSQITPSTGSHARRTNGRSGAATPSHPPDHMLVERMDDPVQPNHHRQFY